MTQLERQIRAAQHRLWLNRWLAYLCWCIAGAGGVFAAVVLVQRLYEAAVPLLWVGPCLGAGALTVSIVWTTIRRETSGFAAAMLDQAAGLHERISSGRYCASAASTVGEGYEDPFARAVVADAERISSSLSARQHIRLTAPQPLALTGVIILTAALMFLVPPGLLKRSEATESTQQAVALRQTKVAVKRKMDEIRRMVDDNPAAKDLTEDFKSVDKESGGQLRRPGDIRHVAVKRIDKLQDAVKRKQQSGRYGMANEMRRMMRGLKVPKESNAPTQKLAKALAQGDFKTAQDEIRKLREQLATLKFEKDKELVVKMSKQLDDLAKQLEQLAVNRNLARKLLQAGLSKEDVDRLLENLKKKDLDQLAKQLEQKGWDQKQIQQLAKQLEQQQQAGSAAKQLSQAMKQASKCGNPGQMGEALAGLAVAGDQLSNLEMLEQEMNQLGSLMTDLQSAKDDLENDCSHCNGMGMKNGRLCGQ